MILGSRWLLCDQQTVRGAEVAADHSEVTAVTRGARRRAGGTRRVWEVELAGAGGLDEDGERNRKDAGGWG